MVGNPVVEGVSGVARLGAGFQKRKSSEGQEEELGHCFHIEEVIIFRCGFRGKAACGGCW